MTRDEHASHDREGQLTLRPVGFARTPYTEKADAPRQPQAAIGVAGTLEILPAYRDALSDLEGFDRLVVLFGFDRATQTSSLKVQPPRSSKKRGVFATRSPHRPNPLGLSIVRLARVEGLTLHVEDVDFLDKTPIYDIKPYLAYTDAFPDARAGWLEEDPTDEETARVAGATRSTPGDPRAGYDVTFSDEAREACAFVEDATGLALEHRVREHLSLGPAPHAYRRIRREGDLSVLAVKEWRVVFTTRPESRVLEVVRVRSGASPRDLAREDTSLVGGAGGTSAKGLETHRRFVERFGR